MTDSECSYCNGSAAGRLVWSDSFCRVLLIENAPFTGLCRVVWNEHVTELTDLNERDRTRLFSAIATVEEGLRGLLAPDKMNLAALGTQMPHLHWHVIPRYKDDTHYPEPIWAPAVRSPSARTLPEDFLRVFGAFLDDRLGPSRTPA